MMMVSLPVALEMSMESLAATSQARVSTRSWDQNIDLEIASHVAAAVPIPLRC